jgi:4,5-dihydroxyphthalate decarboxylase
MLQYNEFQACEMSLSNTTSLMSGPNPPFIAIPVYPSRVFRHGYFFINTERASRAARIEGQARRCARNIR